jgi:2'-5' RNA ligase
VNDSQTLTLTSSEEPVYSIWIVPTGPVRKSIDAVLSGAAFASQQRSLVPHLTIIGDLVGDKRALRGKTDDLAALLQPFPVTIDRLVCTNECAVLSIELEGGIAAAREASVALFSQRRNQLYRPHMTLLYDRPAELAKASLEHKVAAMPRSFIADAIHIVRTPLNSPPCDWQMVESIALRVHGAPEGEDTAAEN